MYHSTTKRSTQSSFCITMESTRIYATEFDNLRATELRLGLPGTDDEPTTSRKRAPDPDTKLSEAEQPVAKAQVVGWPPVRSYRKKNSFHGGRTEIFVKVSMDGAPYLRKIDLKVYKGYKELREGLEKMFTCFASEHAIAYEDKDGDWMLVGDVPWEMFISSCKRLRIMRGAEARGLSSNP